jgi:solute:Na+ symporter, SSS family
MHLTAFDWILPIVLVLGLAAVGLTTRKYGQSVAGFLAANRCAGRYLIALADARASIGLITLAWYFQQNYDVGYTSVWWGLSEGPIMVFLALTGWVAYRFRRTRALTLAQFLEMRYDRNFRIFCGSLAFLAGLLNYGVFPGISARFLIHLMGLPAQFSLAGAEFDTYLVFMVVMLSTALFFIFLGGQVTVMVTDFIQGVFCNLVFAALTLYLLWKFPWSDLGATMLAVGDGKSLVNPAPSSLEQEENFNITYWAIQAIIILYTAKAWQGDQGYNAAAVTPHESKMANILNGWRFRVLMIVTLVVPLCIRTLLDNPAYAEAGASVRAAVGALPPEQASELRTPVALGLMIPAGLLGFVIAALFGAYLGTDNAYLHSWGSILVQDVVMPIRQRLGLGELSAKAHIRTIKFAIFSVAVWGFVFSATFRSPDQRIAMYCNLSASLFYAGAGCAIIGGLYTRRGSSASAWAGMLTGVAIAAQCLFVKEFGGVWKGWEHSLPPVWSFLKWIDQFNGQVLGFTAMVAATAVYATIAVMRPANFDLDRMLHRGKHRVPEDQEEIAIEADRSRSFWEKIGLDGSFTGWDRVVTWITLAWPIAGTLLFAVVTPFLLGDDPPADHGWIGFWRWYTYFTLAVGTTVVIWFSIGGFRDLRRMYRLLAQRRADARDDGSVEKPRDA